MLKFIERLKNMKTIVRIEKKVDAQDCASKMIDVVLGDGLAKTREMHRAFEMEFCEFHRAMKEDLPIRLGGTIYTKAGILDACKNKGYEVVILYMDNYYNNENFAEVDSEKPWNNWAINEFD
mgnify:CR=1 FL=1